MRILTLSLVIAVALGLAVPASAQVYGPRSERPYRGLFAGDTGNASQLLTFTASGGAGYDDDIFAQGIGTARPTNGAGGSTTFIVGSAGLGYSVATHGMALSASFGSGTGYYPGLNQPVLVHHSGGVSTAFQVARHSTVSVSQFESYQPVYFFAFLPTHVAAAEVVPTFDPGTMNIGDAVQAASLTLRQPVVADATVASNVDYYLTSETGLVFTQGLTQHLTFTAGYGYRRSDSGTPGRDYTSQSVTASLAYSVTREVSVHAGYGYNSTQYEVATGGSTDYRGRTIDAGVAYNKALSFSRRTTLGFSTGTAAVDDGVQTHWAITGQVQLTREIGRSWSAGLGYSRSVSYVETFRAPVLSDAATATLTGLLSRETQFEAVASISRGDVGYVANNNYETYFAGAGVRRALSRNVGLSARYAIYRYSIASGVLIPVGLADRAFRQSIGVSIDFWKPLIQTNRSANVTR